MDPNTNTNPDPNQPTIEPASIQNNDVSQPLMAVDVQSSEPKLTTPITNKLKNSKVLVIVVLLLIIVISFIFVANWNEDQVRKNIVNTTMSRSNAQSVLFASRVYEVELDYYPKKAADFNDIKDATNGAVSLPDGIIILDDSSKINSSNGTTTVAWSCESDCTQDTGGGKVSYWNYKKNAIEDMLTNSEY